MLTELEELELKNMWIGTIKIPLEREGEMEEAQELTKDEKTAKTVEEALNRPFLADMQERLDRRKRNVEQAVLAARTLPAHVVTMILGDGNESAEI
jgi:hypothetical protein